MKEKIIAHILLISYLAGLVPGFVFAQSRDTSFLVFSEQSFTEDVQELCVKEIDEQGGILEAAGVRLEIPAGALKSAAKIRISRLKSTAETGDRLTNVTAGRGGYRFQPRGQQFLKDVQISLAYEEGLSMDGLEDLYTYFYENKKERWEALERLKIDKENKMVVSVTSHFTDMINGTLSLPESPGMVGINLNSIKDLQAADALSGLERIEGLEASSGGDASFTMNLVLPPGRRGMSPSVGISYSSEGGHGILGKGFSLRGMQSICFDSRNGVAKYDGEKLLNPRYSFDGDLLELKNGKYLRLREQRHEKIEFKERENYWEVTDTQGRVSTYGKLGWSGPSERRKQIYYIDEIRDVYGNSILYYYKKLNNEDTQNIDDVVLSEIEYGNNRISFSYEKRRDVRIDGRGGHLRGNTQRLTGILIQYISAASSTNIREYGFSYKKESVFFESFLEKIKVRGYIDKDHPGKSYTYTFSYIEPEKNADGSLQVFGKTEIWGVKDGKPDTSIYKKESVSGGGNFSGGTGLGFSAVHFTVSGMGSVGTGSGKSEYQFVDISGDGIADIVEYNGGDPVVYVYKADSPLEGRYEKLLGDKGLKGLEGKEFDLSKDFYWSGGINVGVLVGADKNGASFNFTYTAQGGNNSSESAFMDADGDGLVDFVSKEGFFKNTEGKNFLSSRSFSVPYTRVELSDAKKEEYKKQYYIQEAVQAWRAPQSGNVKIIYELASANNKVKLHCYKKAEKPILMTGQAFSLNVKRGEYLYFVSETDSSVELGAKARLEINIAYTSIAYFSDATRFFTYAPPAQYENINDVPFEIQNLYAPGPLSSGSSIVLRGDFKNLLDKDMRAFLLEKGFYYMDEIPYKAFVNAYTRLTDTNIKEKIAKFFLYDSGRGVYVRNLSENIHDEDYRLHFRYLLNTMTATEQKSLFKYRLSPLEEVDLLFNEYQNKMYLGKKTVLNLPAATKPEHMGFDNEQEIYLGAFFSKYFKLKKEYKIENEKKELYYRLYRDGTLVQGATGWTEKSLEISLKKDGSDGFNAILSFEKEGSVWKAKSLFFLYDENMLYTVKDAAIRLFEMEGDAIVSRKKSVKTYTNTENFNQGRYKSEYADKNTAFFIKKEEGKEDVKISPLPLEALYGGNNNWYYGLYANTGHSPFNFSIEEFLKKETVQISDSNRNDYTQMTAAKTEDRQGIVKDSKLKQMLETENTNMKVKALVEVKSFQDYTESLGTGQGGQSFSLAAQEDGTGYKYQGESLIGPVDSFIDSDSRSSKNFSAYMAGQEIYTSRRGGYQYACVPGLSKAFSGVYLRRNTNKGSEVGIGGGININKVGLNGNVSYNTNESTQELLVQDITGDRIPDIIKKEGDDVFIQEGTLNASGIVFNENKIHIQGINIGTNTSETTVLGGSVGVGGLSYMKRTASGFVESILPAQGSSGQTFSSGSQRQKTTLMDINGDGLADYIDKEGKAVKLNIGYGFSGYDRLAPQCIDDGGVFSFGASISFGLNLPAGVVSLNPNIGLNISARETQSTKRLMDINGDGLLDELTGSSDGYMSLRVNTGSGFSDVIKIAIEKDFGSLAYSEYIKNSFKTAGTKSSAIKLPLQNMLNTDELSQGSTPIEKIDREGSLEYNTSVSVGVSGGLSTTIAIPIFTGINALILASGSGSGSWNSSTVSKRLFDADGDGLADRVFNASNGSIQVQRNLLGKNGLLKTIALPQGGLYELEYEKTGNSLDMPMSKYVLSEVIKKSCLEGLYDAENKQEYRISYRYAGGYYDRQLKEFYGFKTVTSVREDSISETDYYNQSYYAKGMNKETRKYYKGGQGAEQKLYERQSFVLDKAPYARIISEQVKRYDKDTRASFSTKKTYKYDEYGNLIKLFDGGNENIDEDDLQAEISYTSQKDKYLYSLPSCISVKNKYAQLLRKREGEYDSFGNLAVQREYIDEKRYRETKLSWTKEGLIKSQKRPSGLIYEYEYDSVLKQYPVQITKRGNRGGEYTSLIDWNIERGLKISETASNKETMRYRYDELGRLRETRSPYDSK